MKLLLIGPSRYNNDNTVFKLKKLQFPRLNMLHLAALTPKDVEIKIVEEIVEDIDFDENCDLVGITAFTSQAPRAYTIADEFRKRGKTVVMGGIHVSSLPDEGLAHADCVVIGEADYLWEQVVNDFKNTSLKTTYKSEKLHDLKGFPVPRYDLINRKKYRRAVVVQASRGCPHDCDFCSVTKFFGGSYRARPVDEVIRDVKASGVKRIFFADDNIIANRKYAAELFKKLTPLNIRWGGQATITLGHFPDLCKQMSDSGCQHLCVGIESINQASLDTVGKSHNKVSDYYRLIRTMVKNGLSLHFSMIVGLDGDDEAIFPDTLKFVSELKPLRAMLHVPTPYPGTKLAQRLESENRLFHKDWSKYRDGSVVFQPKNFSKERLEELTLSAFKEIYSLKSVLVRCMFQPKLNILYSLALNFLDRKDAVRGMPLNGG